jgi:hypothetical protein
MDQSLLPQSDQSQDFRKVYGSWCTEKLVRKEMGQRWAQKQTNANSGPTLLVLLLPGGVDFPRSSTTRPTSSTALRDAPPRLVPLARP